MKKIFLVCMVALLSVVGFVSAYEIGDTGPGGGMVFYVTANGTQCKEFALNTWAGGTSDPWYNWYTAIATCNALVLNGYDDWYLPDIGELSQIWTNVVHNGAGGNNGVGGFSPNGYWSSSLHQTWGMPYDKHFATGGIDVNTQDLSIPVRPVRAFKIATEYDYSDIAGIVTYKRQTLSEQEICRIVMSKALTGLALAENDVSGNIQMGKTVEGKPYLSIDSGHALAATINAAGGAAWVTASFIVSELHPILLNGQQLSDDQGNIFPAYADKISNLDFTDGVLTFRIYHFSEWSIPQLEAKAFTGSGAGTIITANGSSIIIEAPVGNQQDAGDGAQTVTTEVAKISGLAYETVLNDVQKVGDIYKPMDPSDTDYSVHFGYINRGNATDSFGVVASMVSDNAGHFGYAIAVDNKNVAPWQIVSFSISVTNSAALAFERATLNVTVNIDGDAVSYNAFAGAISTTFGDDGVYGGLDDLSYSFTFETEGYSLKVLNRVATINSPLSDGQFIPGAKVKYEIVIKNESAAVATDVRIKDVIPANTHLYYTDNPLVEGATTWSLESVTDNATATEVEYKITIPANGTVTASYTVTVD